MTGRDLPKEGDTIQLIESITDITIDNKACSISLHGVRLVKKVYEPGLIEAEVAISSKLSPAVLPSMAAVRELLLAKGASLAIKPKDGEEETIAKNYYIYKVDSVLTKNSSQPSLYVKLTAHSIDHRMALDKYSKAFVAKRLAADILLKEYESFGLKTTQVNAELANLRNLRFKRAGQEDEEMIQPYLVQYNETFYDFMVRTANRCGEFLYFEDGQLTLGLPASTQAKHVGAYDSVTLQDYSGCALEIEDYARDGVKDDEKINGFNADAIDKDDAGYPEDAFPSAPAYNAELTHDDFIFPMQKDNFTSYTNDLGFKGADLAVSAAQKIATNEAGYTGIPEMVRSFASDMAVAAIEARSSSNETNSDGNDEYIDIFTAGSPQTDGTRTVQFGTVVKEGWPTLDFYSRVRHKEEEQQRRMVCIDMGQTYASLNLGDKITIDGLEGNYIVVHVSLRSDIKWELNYKRFQDGGDTDLYQGPQSQVVWAIPTYQEGTVETAIPPMVPGALIRKSGPQTAFVIDNGDPKKQGRVRIAYPWQSGGEAKRQALTTARSELDKAKSALEALKQGGGKGEDLEAAEKDIALKENDVDKKADEWREDLKSLATPWIRVVSPLATDGGGAYFKPNPGDEVLVNYDSDNIERPYVVGSVFSKNLNEPNSDHNGTMTLQSPNGQFISLTAGKGSKFLESIAPVLKPIQTYIPAVKNAMKTVDKEIGGGITMSDTYGMFKIDMSSHGRKIDIESPFGKVGISAFTGITINAPNGDIKIKGKNVSIEAGNNLTVKSGTNVNYDDFSLADTIKGMLGDTFKDMLSAGLDQADLGMLTNMKLVDCALIRCVMDTFLKPIEGTLCIKSNNYMKLEAGKGKAQVPLERYSDRWQDYKQAQKDGGTQIVLSKLAAFAKRLDEKISKFSGDYKSAKEKAYEKKAAYDWLVAHLVKKDKVAGLQDIRKEAFKLGDGELKKYDPATTTEGLVKMGGFKQENLQAKTYPGYWVSGFTFLRSEADIQNHIRKVAEEYAEAVYNLQRVAHTAKNVITDETVKAVNKSVVGRTEDQDTTWIDTIFKKEATDILKEMHEEWVRRYGAKGSDPKDDFLSDDDENSGDDPFAETKLYKRLAMTRILVAMYKASENKITAPAAGAAIVAAVTGTAAAAGNPGKYIALSIDANATIDKAFVEKNWKEIASMGDGKESKFKKIVGMLTEFLEIDKQWKPLLDPSAPLMGWAQQMWNDKSGQIIFSNKKGSTYALNGEQIEKYEFRTEKNKESVKEILTDYGDEE